MIGYVLKGGIKKPNVEFQRKNRKAHTCINKNI
jgi:hypothetical protein